MKPGPKRDDLFKVVVLIAIIWGLLGATGALNGTPADTTSSDTLDVTQMK